MQWLEWYWAGHEMAVEGAHGPARGPANRLTQSQAVAHTAPIGTDHQVIGVGPQVGGEKIGITLEAPGGKDRRLCRDAGGLPTLATHLRADHRALVVEKQASRSRLTDDPSTSLLNNGHLVAQERTHINRVADSNRHDSLDLLADRNAHASYLLDGRRVRLHERPAEGRVAQWHPRSQRLKVGRAPEHPD